MKKLLREGTLEQIGWIKRKKGAYYESILISGKRILISSKRVEESFGIAILRVYDRVEDSIRDAFRYSRKKAKNPWDAIYYRKVLRNLLEYLEDRGVFML